MLFLNLAQNYLPFRLLLLVNEAGKLDKTLREREREKLRGERKKKMSHHHHQAVDNFINVFFRASHDLNAVQFKLEKEFQQIYPDNANPMKLIHRIKKLQEDVSFLKDQCLELLSAKQDLIDKAQTTLVGNYNLIQKMNASLGESTNGDDALADFNQIIDEWTMQIRSRTGRETEEADKEDINKLLFSAIVHNN